MALKRVEQRPPHRLPRAAWGQPGQRGREEPRVGRKVAASNEVWEVAPGMINGTGTKIHRTGWRLQGPAGRAGLARRQPRAWARGARGSHAGAGVPARRSRGRDAGVAGGPVLRRTHFPEQTGTGQGVAGKRPLPESRREVWPRRREAVDSTEGPRQPPVWPAGEDTVRLAARPPPAGACSRFL